MRSCSGSSSDVLVDEWQFEWFLPHPNEGNFALLWLNRHYHTFYFFSFPSLQRVNDIFQWPLVVIYGGNRIGNHKTCMCIISTIALHWQPVHDFIVQYGQWKCVHNILSIRLYILFNFFTNKLKPHANFSSSMFFTHCFNLHLIFSSLNICYANVENKYFP